MKIFKAVILGAFLASSTIIFAQGGNTPVPGIDIIVKSEINNPIVKLTLNQGILKKVSGLKDEERSLFLAKVIPTEINRASNLKLNLIQWQNTFREQLLKNRCNPCRTYETFSFKAKDPRSKKSYIIQFDLHTEVKRLSP